MLGVTIAIGVGLIFPFPIIGHLLETIYLALYGVSPPVASTFVTLFMIIELSAVVLAVIWWIRPLFSLKGKIPTLLRQKLWVLIIETIIEIISQILVIAYCIARWYYDRIPVSEKLMSNLLPILLAITNVSASTTVVIWLFDQSSWSPWNLPAYLTKGERIAVVVGRNLVGFEKREPVVKLLATMRKLESEGHLESLFSIRCATTDHKGLRCLSSPWLEERKITFNATGITYSDGKSVEHNVSQNTIAKWLNDGASLPLEHLIAYYVHCMWDQQLIHFVNKISSDSTWSQRKYSKRQKMIRATKISSVSFEGGDARFSE
jgi:hypothetical protein